eukprot:3940837-Rhodomonas_salina.5
MAAGVAFHLWSYAAPTHCPVLTSSMLLPGTQRVGEQLAPQSVRYQPTRAIGDVRYQEGHCDVLCEALKNLFATDQIKERLSDRDCEVGPASCYEYAPAHLLGDVRY